VLVGEATRRLQQAAAGDAGRRRAGIIEWIRASYFGGIYDRLAGLFEQYSIDPSDLALRATQAVSAQIAGQAAGIARDALLSVLNFILMLVALWFLFRDGEAMAQGLRDLIPMEPEHKDAIFARLYTTLTAVVQSMVGGRRDTGRPRRRRLRADRRPRVQRVPGLRDRLRVVRAARRARPSCGSAPRSTCSFIGEVGRAIGLSVWGLLVVSSARQLDQADLHRRPRQAADVAPADRAPRRAPGVRVPRRVPRAP
jgi:hypothetical protein